MNLRPILIMWLKRAFAGWRWVAVLALLAVVTWLALAGLPDGKLHVYFLDVGQGDAILVVAPDGRQILVDGGPSPTALLNEIGAVLPFWDRSLDLVVLTHPDADHMTGLAALPQRYRIGQVLDVPQSDLAPDAEPWLEGLRSAAVPRRYAQRGSSFAVGDLLVTVLHPGSEPLTGTASDDNNNAVVLRLDIGRISLLLTGDTGREAEEALIAAGAPLRADVLKVSHHGGNSATSEAFLAAVSPRLAIISVGAGNNFGHPHPAVLERLTGVEVLRTDLNGRIEVVSDGETMWVKTER